MSMTDPIADLLTRIRNAAMAGKEEVSVPASNIKLRMAEILKEEGYLADVTKVPDRRQGILVLKLKYDENGKPIIRELKRMSKPGRRVYVSVDEIPKVRNGLGVALLSTSRGIMTDAQARKERVGGELLATVW
ncbi:MAG: 30S ribosomal protein S8 [Deltaproteobacteria bacterium]|nr:MAG: 30S ribosomal protein S8 [Deltaproteobacteria bacterium]